MTGPAEPLLVVGIPRSGSTWTGNVLGQAADRPLCHEPDNDKLYLEAFQAKRALGRFPVLAPGDVAPPYEALWRRALSGAPPVVSGLRQRVSARLWRGTSADQREQAVRGDVSARVRVAAALAGRRPPAGSPGPVIVKTVHAPLAVEWLVDLVPQARVILVVRHPANVLSSWLEMDLPDQDRGLDRQPGVRDVHLRRWGVDPPTPGSTQVERAAWQVCLLTAALLDAASRHPTWLVVRHEDLCEAPVQRFEALAGQLDLPWGSAAASFIRDSDQPGDGFAVQRRASDQPQRWRSRLVPADIRALSVAAEQFPGLERWADDLRSAPSR